MLGAIRGRRRKGRQRIRWLDGITDSMDMSLGKIVASSPITSWEIDGETVETVSGFIFGGSKITADGDCSHEIKRRLLLGRNASATRVT